MGSDEERTDGTAGSDQIDSGSEGDARETASDAAPDVAREAGAADAAGAEAAEGPSAEAGEGAGTGAADAAGVVLASSDSDLTEKPAQEDAEVDAKKKKKGKEKDKGIGTSRGIETMFRTSYRVHQDLVSIADAKANIMISVSGLIIAIILGTVAPQIISASWLKIPTSVLLIGCLIALVYAVLAARPRVSNVEIAEKDVVAGKANILFFGNFVNLDLELYEKGMRALMESQDLLYFNMVRDLYGLGKVLDTKFRLLRTSYTVFMFALVLGVGLFILAFAFPGLPIW